jgi:hypothetical protein
MVRSRLRKNFPPMPYRKATATGGNSIANTISKSVITK